MTVPNDDTLRDWLLGRLAPAAAEPLEQRLIEDADFAAHLRAVENDLLDDLARGQLAGDERARAAAYFAATPEDRVRLRIARALAAVGAEAETARSPRGRGHAGADRDATLHRHATRPRRRWMGVALALAGALAIAVIGVRLYPDFGTVPVAFTITLTGGQQRGTSAMEIAIPRDAHELRLQAEVEGSDAAVRYTLSVDDAFAVRGLAVRTTGPYRFVEATVPATSLAPGAHRVRVVADAGAAGESAWMLTTRSE
jgi:hypothetical protein